MTQNPFTHPEQTPAEGQNQAWSASSAPASASSPAAAPQSDPWGAPAASAPSAPAPAASASSANAEPHAYSASAAGGHPYASASANTASTATGTSATGTSASAAGSAKGFFGALFDFSFRHFVTIRFVQVFYIIGIAWALLNYLSGFITFGLLGAGIDPWGDYSAWPIILYILFGWIVPVITVLALRVGLEFVVATIRTSQNTSEIADHLKARG